MVESGINDILIFKKFFLSDKTFNVLLLIKDIDDEILNTLSKRIDVKFYSFNFLFDFVPNINSNKVKLLELHYNSLYEYEIAIKASNVIITDNKDIYDYAKDLNKNVIKISDEKSLIKAKFKLEEYRIQSKEIYLNALAKRIQQNEKDILSSLSKQAFLYETLFRTTLKLKYVQKVIKIKTELAKYDKDNEIKYLSDVASLTFTFTDKKNKAKKIYDKIKDKINDPDMLYSYACFQLSQKNFDEYYKHYDARFITKYEPVKYPNFNKPKWKGEQCTQNKTLLIHYEGGFGDIILFSRHINDVKNLFRKIIFIIKPELKDIIQNSFPDIIVKTDANNLKFDYHVPLSYIPGILKKYPTKDEREKWIKPDNQKIKEYKKYFDNNKFNIGIFYDSTKNFIKRFSDLETFMPLAYIDKVQLYSLHVDKEDIELNYIDDNVHIENLGKHFKDFSDTAAAIENCDLIIATDSSVLNLAGAMGKKTFGLFSEFAECRWYKLEGEDVGWYKSVKPFHAEHENNFKPEIAKICKEIEILRNVKFNK